jgi:Tfp pilus assembly protein PilX
MGRCDFQCQRRGAVLVVVLVCLAVATVVSVIVVRQIAMQYRAMQVSHGSLQAAWLAEAGIERAAARLAADPKYAGETWSISGKRGQPPFADTEGDCPPLPCVVVKIQVETIADQPERRSVRVEADYTDAPYCRQVKEFIVDRDAILSRQQAKAPQ